MNSKSILRITLLVGLNRLNRLILTSKAQPSAINPQPIPTTALSSVRSSLPAADLALGSFYEQHLGGTANRRIAALQTLSGWLGDDGVLQVEAFPFHSASLPRKEALLKRVGECGLLGPYTECLRAFLRNRPVVVVSAVSSRASLKREVVRTLSPWLHWVAAIGGLSLQHANFVRLVTKGRATTAAALVSFEGDAPKALVLMMGGNHLPAEKGLQVLATAIRHS